MTHSPGPWSWRNASGAGLQISATLPAGFVLSGTAREADGKTSFMIWTVRESHWVQIADERWVQFSSGSWDEMQRANACLIATAPELLDALEPFGRVPLLCTEGIDDSATVFEFEGGQISLGDLRRVHAALSKAKGKSVEALAFTPHDNQEGSNG